MAVFAYRGRNASGDLQQGTLEGEDSVAVADQLIKQGITPTDIKPSGKVSAAAVSGVSLWQSLNEKKIDVVELMLFSRQMHTLLKAGVPIMRALAGLQESSQNPALAAVLRSLRESLDSGRELSAAMRLHPKVFSAFYVSMVQVGEMTGMLDETFMRLYGHLEFEKAMNESIKSALRYPMFVAIAMAIAIVVVNIFVIPAFAKVFAGFHTELPLMTRMLMGFSGFMIDYWALMLALIIGAVVGFRKYISTIDGRYRWDKYKLEIPIAGKIILKSTLSYALHPFQLRYNSRFVTKYLFTTLAVSHIVPSQHSPSEIRQ